MTEPGSNGVDVDPSTKEMDSRRVSDRMGAYAFDLHRLDLFGRYLCAGRNDAMHPEPGQRLTGSSAEHLITGALLGDER